METLLTIFSETRVVLTFLTAVVAVIYAITAGYLLKRYRVRPDVRESRNKLAFFSALDDGIGNETIQTLGDLVNVYKGVRDLSSEDLTYRPHLSRWLREYLVFLVSGRVKAGALQHWIAGHDDEDQALPDEERQKYKQLVTKFIEENEASSPYADLPGVERSIIADISNYANAQNTDGVIRKLDELASAVQAREDIVNRAQATNRWAVPIAVVGLVLTVFFGILSLL